MSKVVSRVVVVVADAGAGSQFVRCLTQVVGTVPADVEVVGVSARFPRLPSAVSARVEQVRVRHADEVAMTVDDLSAGESTASVVIAVAARALLRTGWFEAAVEQAGHVPHQIAAVGVGPSRLVRVLPGGVAPSRLTTYPLPGLTGVSEEPARAVAPTQDPGLPAPRHELDGVLAALTAVPASVLAG